MKDALRIPQGKTLRDFQRIGQCVICHNAIYGWTEAEQDYCGDPDCEHPDDLCSDPDCAEERRRIYKGDRKLKNPCGFPRLRNKMEK